jgi:hypothetical protein
MKLTLTAMTTDAPLTTLFLKVPRNIEISPESAKTFLATLTGIGNVTMLKRFRCARKYSPLN